MLGDLENWLQVPIEIIRPGVPNFEGDSTPVDSIKTKCFVENKIAVVTNRAGREVVSNAVIYLNGTLAEEINYDCRVKIGADTKEFNIELIKIDTNRFGEVSLVRLIL